MSLDLPAGVVDYQSFPRVSGDEPAFISEDSVSMGFSPRERG